MLFDKLQELQELQLTIYMVQLITIQLQLYATIHFQLLTHPQAP